MLAMDVNDNACVLNKRVALEFIASMLAPTNAAGIKRGLTSTIAQTVPCSTPQTTAQAWSAAHV
ncbi:hypothetical protein C1886_11725 [Pseudomonas sp. FW300-N1A1]|nr:hypothetical protein C1886_11725 [Pseudomonas sp. FW300-N1A1]